MQALSANFKALQIQDVKEFGNTIDIIAIIYMVLDYMYIYIYKCIHTQHNVHVPT